MWRRFPLVQGALRRGNFWPNTQAAKARYASRPPFVHWADGVLDDYLTSGLRLVEGGVALSCDPAWEAANYASHRHDPVRAARHAGVPVQVLKAGKASTVMDEKGLIRAGTAITPLPSHSHLAPMENPAACAAWIAQIVEGFASF